MLPAGLVRDGKGRAAAVPPQERLGKRCALDEPLDRLAGTATRGDDTPVLVEHHDDLAALLDERVRALGLEPQA